MPSIAKEEKLRTILEDVKSAQAIWVIDFRGLTVKESEELRARIREAGAVLKVHKNTLTKLALSELELPTMDSILEGPSAFVFAPGDPVASAKALKAYSQENKKVQIKGGIMDGRELSVDQVIAVADLPSREQLLAMLLQTMQGPATKLVRVLNGPMEKFARTLDAIKDTKVA